MCKFLVSCPGLFLELLCSLYVSSHGKAFLDFWHDFHLASPPFFFMEKKLRQAIITGCCTFVFSTAAFYFAFIWLLSSVLLFCFSLVQARIAVVLWWLIGAFTFYTVSEIQIALVRSEKEGSVNALQLSQF